MNLERILRELLSRKDPHGFYVIPCDKSSLKLLETIYQGQIAIEVSGDMLFVKTRSRSIAEKIARQLYYRGLLRL